MPDETIGFVDRAYGRYEQNLEQSAGDFVLRRADGPFAYQLAVMLDDADQGVTDIVRGADLLSATPRQIFLQRALGLARCRYLHVPLALNESGEKLSKQTGAAAVRSTAPGEEIWRALWFLKQHPPDDLRGAPPEELWDWAAAHWNADVVAWDSATQCRALPLRQETS